MTVTCTGKKIDPSTPTRYAVVQVLTTHAKLTSGDIIPLLRDCGYYTSTVKLRGSLNRLARKGLVEKTRRYEKKHGASGWNLTASGATFTIAASGHHATNGKGITHLAKGSGGTQKSSKGSSGRTSSMCTYPQMPTLTSAVKFVVAGMLSAGKNFSAHDITKKMREEVETLKIDQAETGTVHVNGKAVANIKHDLVRDIVTETFHAGEMTGYDRVHNGTYFEYKPVAAAPSAPDPSTPPDPAKDVPPTSGSSYDGTPTL